MLEQVSAHTVEDVQMVALAFGSRLKVERFNFLKHGGDFGARVNNVTSEAAAQEVDGHAGSELALGEVDSKTKVVKACHDYQNVSCAFLLRRTDDDEVV